MSAADRPRFGWSPGGGEPEARAALARLGKHLYARGLLAGHAGNLSLRLSGGALLVTPRGVHKGWMESADPVVVSAAPARGEDVLRATTELPLHRACYRAADGVHAVIHTHAPALTAMGSGSMGPEDLPPEVAETLGNVLALPWQPSGSEALADLVHGAVAGGAAVILLRRHGVVTVGGSLEEALDRMELAELSARSALLARGGG